jgi:glycosyltransferase involved in cell wall biosynthesis
MVLSPKRSLSVCFVAHNAYGAIAGETSGFIGGIEHQQAMMARWLAARGHDISLITWDEGQSDGVRIDGVRVLKTCRRDAGWPGIRFLAPRWTSLVAAMRRADAQVYYQNCAEYVTGQVALFAKARDRAFVYTVASDPDCDPSLPTLATVRERVLYRHGLMRADAVVVQTSVQGRMLRQGFGRDSIVIPMPAKGPNPATYAAPQPPAPGKARVAWVGRVAPVKRLELLLDVARQMPDVHFDVAGPWDPDANHTTSLRSAADAVPNVSILGRLSREALGPFYREHQALICTSAHEGFPNTFLEAWSHGVPVVSTVDPDGLIASRGLGDVAVDARSLADRLRAILASTREWAAASERARRYFLETHDFETVMPRFESVLAEAARRKP